ncbi:MAG: VOC family protein [Caldilineales bacterium]
MTIYGQAKPAGVPTWVDLATPDLDQARAFYRALFGWEYDVAGPEFGNYTMSRVGQHPVAGMGGNTSPDGTTFPVAWGLYFATDDIETDVARAVALGATVMVPAMVVDQFGSMATLVDPGGAVFSFWQAGQHIGAQVTDEPGAMTWCELYAADAKQSRDFYAALLQAAAEPMPGDFEYYVFKQGETMLGGVMQIDPAWGDFHPNWAIYFAVADADKATATIVQHGGKVFGPVEDTPFGRMTSAMDPYGAHFKIIQLPS